MVKMVKLLIYGLGHQILFRAFKYQELQFLHQLQLAAGVGIKKESIDRISVSQLQTDLTNASATGLLNVLQIVLNPIF